MEIIKLPASLRLSLLQILFRVEIIYNNHVNIWISLNNNDDDYVDWSISYNDAGTSSDHHHLEYCTITTSLSGFFTRTLTSRTDINIEEGIQFLFCPFWPVHRKTGNSKFYSVDIFNPCIGVNPTTQVCSAKPTFKPLLLAL